MNNKGFLLIDSLVNICVVCALCLLCFSIYRVLNNESKVFDSYIEESNERYTDLFNNLGECEKCVIEETEDLSSQDTY